jgi:hypothetical protein
VLFGKDEEQQQQHPLCQSPAACHWTCLGGSCFSCFFAWTKDTYQHLQESWLADIYASRCDKQQSRTAALLPAVAVLFPLLPVTQHDWEQLLQLLFCLDDIDLSARATKLAS